MAVTVTNQSNFRQQNRTDTSSIQQSIIQRWSGTLYMVATTLATALQFIFARYVADATASTTATTMVLYCPASSKRSYVFQGYCVFNGFSHWCTTGAAGTSAPATPPTVRYAR